MYHNPKASGVTGDPTQAQQLIVPSLRFLLTSNNNLTSSMKKCTRSFRNPMVRLKSSMCAII